MRLPTWTTYTPILAATMLVLTWGRYPGAVVLTLAAVLLMGAVVSAVHHAEVVAHKVGEPFGSLLLAVAVTIIEVGLIVTLMVTSEGDTSGLARDTVFAAVMITINGIMGLSLLVSATKHRLAVFNPEGTASALTTVIILATICLVLPTFTTSESGPEYSGTQLAFAAIASLVLYGMFVATQTGEYRDFFLPVGRDGVTLDQDGDGHADPPAGRTTAKSVLLLVVSLVSVVGLAKIESPSIEDAVDAVGFPNAVVGVVIALLVLAPESIAAVRAAARERVQVSLNLALGSAMASIGLTIPAIAIASIWLDGPLALGIDSVQIVMLFMTVIVSILTVLPGRSKPLQGGVHLVVFAAFVFLTIAP